MSFLFTSESVTEGHPDKVCDQISDTILDECLKIDKNSRVACETMISKGIVIITGEITTKAKLDYKKIVRNNLYEIGHSDEASGMDVDNCKILVEIKKQSIDISNGIQNTNTEIGAGDQGMMFGYASDETEEYLPMPFVFANLITKRLSEIRKSGELDYLLPDGKAQITMRYFSGVPEMIDTIVISTQHKNGISLSKIQHDILTKVIESVIPKKYINAETKIHINPSGRFVNGGPNADAGLTGRKIIADTYGSVARHGGGAFSGKDATKVDRSGAYYARYIAKNIIAAKLAHQCEVQLSYVIGISSPISIYVNSYGTGIIEDEQLSMLIEKFFDGRPAEIITKFDLREPQYQHLAAYGHFGRIDVSPKWEDTDIANNLHNYVKENYGKQALK